MSSNSCTVKKNGGRKRYGWLVVGILTRGDALICRRSTSRGEKVGPVAGRGKREL